MAVVVAQLVERSLPTPEVHGSKIYNEFSLSTVIKRRKKKNKKRLVMAHLKNQSQCEYKEPAIPPSTKTFHHTVHTKWSA